MAKDTRIAFRSSVDMKNRLQQAAERVGLSETTLAEACVEALIRYIEEHGEIRMPLSIIPTSELEKKGGDAASNVKGRYIPPEHGGRSSSSTARGLAPQIPDRVILNEELQSDELPVPRRDITYTKSRRKRISEQD